MPTPRKPQEILELTDYYSKHPERRRNSPKSKFPIGNAPEHLTPLECEVWNEIVLISAPGVLLATDRMILARFCQLESKVRDCTATASDSALHIRVLSLLGLTPIDRQRISGLSGTNESENPFSSYTASRTPAKPRLIA
jgi:hypothetical protein